MPRLTRWRCAALVTAFSVFAFGDVALAGPGDGSGQGGGGSGNGTITAEVNWWSNGGGTGSSSGCTWLLVTGGLAVDGVGEVHWPRDVDGVVLNLWRRTCPDGESWFELPVIDPTTQLLPLLLTRLQQEQLPKPSPVFAALDPEFGWAYVRTPIDFRVGGGTWRTVTVTASIGPYWVRVTATPGTLTFDPGDVAGSPPASCGGSGPIAKYVAEDPGACSYTYDNASSTSVFDGYHFLTGSPSTGRSLGRRRLAQEVHWILSQPRRLRNWLWPRPRASSHVRVLYLTKEAVDGSRDEVA